ncbi:MAG: ABC transporter permease [Chloroflexi bacterium]|nr:ABC transporter permease [Chloroflexota bacterium]
MSSTQVSSKPARKRSFSLRGLISPGQFVLGIILAFLAGAVLLWAFGEDAVVAYAALYQGAFGSQRTIAETLLSTTPLILGGLAVAVGFRCGLFNMGVEGTIVLGGLVAAWIGYAIALPPIVHLLVALLGGAVMGGIWGGIPGYLKARYNIHEVITTIMLNYIAFAIAGYMVAVGGPMKDVGQLPTSPEILATARLDRIMPPTRLSGGIFIALAMALLTWFFLFRTRYGYKLRAVGLGRDAAAYVGISPQRYMVLAMVLSGALGGLAGAVEVLGVHYRFYENFSPGYGWDAIAVALLGLVHPFGVVAAAFIFGALRSGSVAMQAVAQISKDVVLILSAFIIFFMAMNQSLRPILERRFTRLEAKAKERAPVAAHSPAD